VDVAQHKGQRSFWGRPVGSWIGGSRFKDQQAEVGPPCRKTYAGDLLERCQRETDPFTAVQNVGAGRIAAYRSVLVGMSSECLDIVTRK